MNRILLVSFTDMIKNKFLNEFSGNFSVEGIIISLLVAFLLGLFILFVYKVSYSGAMFNKSFAFSLVLLAMITSLIIATINSNLALSLGMVGALSIVRFRTAIKDPVDTTFMFWAVAAGIMVGAGLYYVSVLATAVLGILYILLTVSGFKIGSDSYLLIVRYQLKAEEQVISSISKYSAKNVKSKTATKEDVELVYEIRANNRSLELTHKLNQISGVESATVISYRGEYAR